MQYNIMTKYNSKSVFKSSLRSTHEFTVQRVITFSVIIILIRDIIKGKTCPDQDDPINNLYWGAKFIFISVQKLLKID